MMIIDNNNDDDMIIYIADGSSGIAKLKWTKHNNIINNYSQKWVSFQLKIERAIGGRICVKRIVFSVNFYYYI